MPKKKRLVVIADLHCGNRVGLTPPSYHRPHSDDKFHKVQIELWDLYSKKINELKPIDILVVNGDAIDGRGERSGSRELIEVDRKKQCNMAAWCINYADAKHVVMTYGTGYHSGNRDDWEDSVAEMVSADKIGGHEFINVNGLVFDFKHKVGSSTIPHGRHTPIAKEKLWNIMWHEKENQPNSDVIVRSHTHYFDFCGDSRWLGMTTPALQGLGTMYGTRQCSGTVDWGFVWFDVDSKGSYLWNYEVVDVVAQRAPVLKF